MSHEARTRMHDTRLWRCSATCRSKRRRELYVELAKVEELSPSPNLGRVQSVCMANLDANMERWKHPDTASEVPLQFFKEPSSASKIPPQQQQRNSGDMGVDGRKADSLLVRSANENQAPSSDRSFTFSDVGGLTAIVGTVQDEESI
uniref:Uncharacterized protein n=1 Tax=Chromera velia CCMP2878 TaxID=1169474 RepID=A0A0G4H3Y8_9ALVE|eukprot:Cvel_5640.t1-p1 / transcript=Cvel_5640.t1 / gene=Cvel_5640 / organism=Chromera_velia_CCMP2878 / gene_product=hypothetical protein / transcript_product=hypothetical protein / location=Cvel_scaffold266:9409-11345(+) / protein_length=146 / sequence_SO=supercontig / SO=protein_coding / is_pseudo=false